MPRYKLTVAFEGTDFHGWQRQHQPGEEALRTVQGVLQQAVVDVVREPITLVGASRTDAGVHARGQVAAFTCDSTIEPKRLAAAVNSRLPDDVQIRRASIVDDDFSPISDAVAKGYRYRITYGNRGRHLPPLFDRRFVYFSGYQLDPARMNDAARHLIGEHDFASFTRLNHGRESTVRTIHNCTVTALAKRRCRIDVSGDGFLYNMVRIIAGTLVEVGRGKLEPDDVPKILAAVDRTAAGTTLPPEGLFLMSVKYAEQSP